MEAIAGVTVVVWLLGSRRGRPGRGAARRAAADAVREARRHAGARARLRGRGDAAATTCWPAAPRSCGGRRRRGTSRSRCWRPTRPRARRGAGGRRRGGETAVVIKWVLGGVVVIVVAVVAVSLLRGADTPPAPKLPKQPAGATPSGELEGTLRPADGSFVGYRVDETLIGIGLNTAVGRTGEVKGSARIEGGRIVDARFEADTRTLRSDEARRDDALRHRGLETDRYPVARLRARLAREARPALHRARAADAPRPLAPGAGATAVAPQRGRSRPRGVDRRSSSPTTAWSRRASPAWPRCATTAGWRCGYVSARPRGDLRDHASRRRVRQPDVRGGDRRRRRRPAAGRRRPRARRRLRRRRAAGPHQGAPRRAHRGHRAGAGVGRCRARARRRRGPRGGLPRRHARARRLRPRPAAWPPRTRWGRGPTRSAGSPRWFGGAAGSGSSPRASGAARRAPAYLEGARRDGGRAAGRARRARGRARATRAGRWSTSVVASDDDWAAYEETLIANGEAELARTDDPALREWVEAARARWEHPDGKDTLGFALLTLRKAIEGGSGLLPG